MQKRRLHLGVVFLSMLLTILIILYALGILKLFVVKGNSMYPIIQSGKLIIGRVVAGIPEAHPQINKIYVYEDTEGFIVHRLIRCDDFYYYFKGDNLVEEDEPVSKGTKLYYVLFQK